MCSQPALPTQSATLTDPSAVAARAQAWAQGYDRLLIHVDFDEWTRAANPPRRS